MTQLSKKCKFGREDVKFLEHVITASEGVLPTSENSKRFQTLRDLKTLKACVVSLA